MNLKPEYNCDVWLKTPNNKILKVWSKIIPQKSKGVGLPIKVRRFTLIKSPLGSKASKDQYEILEYGYFVSIRSFSASSVLKFLDILKHPVGVKFKISVSVGACCS